MKSDSNNKKHLMPAVIVLCCVSLLACGGGGGSHKHADTPTEEPTEPDPPIRTQPIGLNIPWRNTLFDLSSYMAEIVETEAATLDGKWMMIEDVSETFTDAGTQQQLVALRTLSRQLVSITQQGNAAQIRTCKGDTWNGTQSGATLAYQLPDQIKRVRTWSVPEYANTPRTLVRARNGFWYSQFDSGALAVTAEIFSAIQFRQQSTLTLIRVSPDPQGRIGTLNLDWTFDVPPNVPPSQQESGAVNCFVESVRFREAGDRSLFPEDDFDIPIKTLVLDTDLVRITMTSNLYFLDNRRDEQNNLVSVDPPMPMSHQTVERVPKAIPAGATSFGAVDIELDEQEKNSFTAATPQLLRQQYSSELMSLTGAISLQRDHQFLHGDFALQW